jgi:hypothetical protein
MRRPGKRSIQPSNIPGISTGRTSKDAKPDNEIMWNPFWLRRMWLGAYAVLFGILAVATLTLYLVSKGRHGLGVFKNTTETVYFWKFGPTAGMFKTTTSHLSADLLQFWWQSLHCGTLSTILLDCFSLGPTSQKVLHLHPVLCYWIMCLQSSRRSYTQPPDIVNGPYF